MALYRDIPQLPTAHYRIEVPWRSLESHLQYMAKNYQLDMSPDFQRAHVWTPSQQIAYVEWILRGGESGKEVYFNCPGWLGRSDVGGPMILVDGKQRIEAVLSFLRGGIPAFGYTSNQYEDNLRITSALFRVSVAVLQTRADVLRWYLAINAGGTPHTAEEIARVKELLIRAEREENSGNIQI